MSNKQDQKSIYVVRFDYIDPDDDVSYCEFRERNTIKYFENESDACIYSYEGILECISDRLYNDLNITTLETFKKIVTLIESNLNNINSTNWFEPVKLFCECNNRHLFFEKVNLWDVKETPSVIENMSVDLAHNKARIIYLLEREKRNIPKVIEDTESITARKFFESWVTFHPDRISPEKGDLFSETFSEKIYEKIIENARSFSEEFAKHIDSLKLRYHSNQPTFGFCITKQSIGTVLDKVFTRKKILK